MNARYLRQKSLLRFIIVCFVLCLFTGRLWALDARYKRNGECYLFVTERSNGRYGIYRLNNAEKDIVYDDATHYKVVTPDADSSLAFAVDLDKNIYTFSEKIAGGYNFLSNLKLKRQVLDRVDPDQADYGEHTWIHYDHRYDLLRGTGFSVQPNVYRVGPINRGIRDNWGGIWGGFRSAGPGNSISAPKNPKLPYFSSSALQDYVHWGQNWYEIPNGAWYSSWKEGYAYCNGMTKFYYVFGDFIKGKAHNWQKYTHTPDNIYRDKPNYTQRIGEVVATNYEQQISRYALAGCLDGCGGASGNESVAAEQVYTDLAFVPLKGGDARTYFYSRTMGDTDGVIKLNNSEYSPAQGNPIVGDPTRTDTQWIGVSARDKNSDYVYALGTSVIEEWYEAFFDRRAHLNIQAVAVSNQWNQKGAIVYAYDMNKGMVFKFTRDEGAAKPEKCEGIPVDNLFAREHMHIGVKREDRQIDDLKADGFGNLYFGFSYPTRNWSSYWGYYYYEIGDAKAISYPISYESRWINWRTGWKDIGRGYLVFILDYNKAVYRLKDSDRSVQRMGGMNFSREYYSMPVAMYREDWDELKSMLIGSPLPNSRLDSFIKERTKKPGCYFGKNYDRVVDKPGDFNTGVPGDGSLGEKKFIDYVIYGIDRSNGRLSVINVPTPPEVGALAGKDSYLDIIGPYEDFPIADVTNRHTNQSEYLMVGEQTEPATLATDKTYYFMAENYPVPMPEKKNADHEYELSGSQDPRSQKDWNNNTKLGGFVSSVERLKFTWTTWMVEDAYGKHYEDPKTKDKVLCEQFGDCGHDYFHYLYSPKAGKFIITCHVKGKFYDYDSLEFGTTADDCAGCLREFTAFPSGKGSAVGNMVKENPLQRLKEIAHFDNPGDGSAFNFMCKPTENFSRSELNTSREALFNEYWQKIRKVGAKKGDGGENSDCIAMIPIVLEGSNPNVPDFIDVAQIERCNEKALDDKLRANAVGKTGRNTDVEKDKKNHWVYHDEHGVACGENYYWRIALASQTNMLEDIYVKEHTYVAQMLTKDEGRVYVNNEYIEKNPFFVNRKPGFQFVDEVEALKWRDDKINVKAYLEFKVPADEGDANGHIERMTLVNEERELKTDAPGDSGYLDNLIILKTPSMPTTDPKTAKLTIEMSRFLFYKMYIRIKTPTTGEWLTVASLWLPKQMKIKGETNVRVIDTQGPKIVYAETSPNNLFGYTGCKLTDCPKNTQNGVHFTLYDNNPWEAVDGVEGLSSADVAQSNLNHNAQVLADRKVYINDPTYIGAAYNLKPVFSKKLQTVSLAFQTTQRAKALCVSDPATYSTTLTENGLKKCYDAAYKINTPMPLYSTNVGSKDVSKLAEEIARSDDRPHYRPKSRDEVRDKIWPYDVPTSSGKILNEIASDTNRCSRNSCCHTLANGTVIRRAMLGFKIGLASIFLGTEGNTVPVGYANNTPGYEPYKFYLTAIDSSGNIMKQRELNLALNVVDTIPPVPYLTVTCEKGNEITSTSCVPYCVKAITPNTGSDNADKVASSTEYIFKKALTQNVVSEGFVCNGLGEGQAVGNKPMYSAQAVKIEWKPNSSGNIGLVGSSAGGYKETYRALKSLGGEIKTQLNGRNRDEAYAKLVKEGVPLLPAEDNVKVTFTLEAVDNAGCATANLTYKYLDIDGEETKRVQANYLSAATQSEDITKACATIVPGQSICVFHGAKSDFPYAIPITIEAVDDARDFNYREYEFEVRDDKDLKDENNPELDELYIGWKGDWSEKFKFLNVSGDSPQHNKRTLKTSMPVYSSYLKIRTIEKSTIND